MPPIFNPEHYAPAPVGNVETEAPRLPVTPPQDPRREHARRAEVFDLYLLEVGTSELTARAGQLRSVTLGARSPGEASAIAVANNPGFYVVDVRPHGMHSPIALSIRAGARQREDAKARREWERGGTPDDIRSIVGSRGRQGS